MAEEAPRPARRKKKRSRPRIWLLLLAALLLSAALVTWGWFSLQGAADRAAELLAVDPANAPVTVLAAPRVLRVGERLDLDRVEAELSGLEYRKVTHAPKEAGEYRRGPSRLELFRRAHRGESGPVTAAPIRIELEAGQIASLRGSGGAAREAFVLEPAKLGAFRSDKLEERRPLALAEFPKRLPEAVLASEDARFLEHHGLDMRGLARALWNNLTGGDTLQGGSTITQQVLKNRVLGTARSLKRKLPEMALAPLIENRVGKERLLEIYLNECYLGQQGAVSIVGFPAAARFYFGKDVRQLRLDEVAILAGMIPSPGRFNPRTHPVAARERRDHVLRRLVELERIGVQEADAAKKRPIEVGQPRSSSDVTGDVLDAVGRELAQRGWEPRPSTEARTVFTTIDAELQQDAHNALQRVLTQLEKRDPKRAPLEGAIVVLRPTTGEILALVGGREGTRGALHRALDARRQPGSAMKPFVVLAAYRSGRYGPATILDDSPLTVTTRQGPWSPENFDRTFRGPVTLRRTLEESINLPTVRLVLDLGPEAVVQAARDAGIESPLPLAPSIGLGTGEVQPLELARAYATLADLGVRRSPRLVEAVSGEEESAAITLAPVPLEERTIEPADSWMVLDTMSGVAERGTARALAATLSGKIVAAKTGSTQDGRDAWFVLVTGSAVVVTWVGRDDARPAHLTGAEAALPVVAALIRDSGSALLTPLPERPEGVIEVEICAETGMRAGSKCPLTSREVFRQGAEPALCDKHLSFFRRLFHRSR